MTDKMIVPNSVQDGTTSSHAETTEPSEFQQFEFWVNGVKRIIKIPMHSVLESNTEAYSKIVSVEPGDVDEVQSCSVSAAPIVIDPESNGDGRLSIPANHEESTLTNFVALDSVGHKNRTTEPQNNQSISSQNDQDGINHGSLNPSKAISCCKNGKSLIFGTELEMKQLHHLPKSYVATCINQSITSQPRIRTDVPVIPSFVSNTMSWPLIRGIMVPSVMSKSLGQPVEKLSNSKACLIPSDYVKSSNSNIPWTLSDSGSKSLVQTVNSGIPLIITNSASRPVVRNGDIGLPAAVSNGSVSYILQSQWQPNNATSENVGDSVRAMLPELTKQAASHCKRYVEALRPQTCCIPVQATDNPMSSIGANRNTNLPQFVVPPRQSSAPTTSSSSQPILLDSSSTQVRKVKITTDNNGSCIISVDGDRSQASSSSDEPTSSQMSNILTTGGVLHRAMPYALPNGTTFQVMHSGALQNFQAIQLMPSGRGTLHLIPSNALVNQRPISLESLKLLPNDKAFCLKPQNCKIPGLPPLFCAPQNAGLVGFEASQAQKTGLAVQSMSNNVLVSGALSVGSVLASSTSSLPIGMLPLCSLPSSLSVHVKNSGVTCSTSSKSNNAFMYCGLSSGHTNSNSSVQSASLTPTCLPCVLPVTDVSAYRNTVSIPSAWSSSYNSGIACNKPKDQLRLRGNRLHAQFQPPVAEYSSSFEAGQYTSAIADISKNSVVSPDTSILLNKYRVNNKMDTVSTLPLSAVSGALTTTSVSVAKATSSSFLVSSASGCETPIFPRWSSSTVGKSRDGLVPCRASLLSASADMPSLSSIAVAKSTWYPPKICSQANSAMTYNLAKSHCLMSQTGSSTGSTVPLCIPTKVAHASASTLSSCPNDTSSRLTFSDKQSIRSSSTVRVTKSAFSFYNSRFKPPVCTSLQKSLPSFTSLPSNTSLTSETLVTSVVSSQKPSVGPTEVPSSSLIPISVEFYESSIVSGHVPKKEKA